MSKKLTPVYVLLIADENGNFDWIYTAPQLYYLTREEAEKVREDLILEKEKITKENTMVKRFWKMEDTNKELKN